MVETRFEKKFRRCFIFSLCQVCQSCCALQLRDDLLVFLGRRLRKKMWFKIIENQKAQNFVKFQKSIHNQVKYEKKSSNLSQIGYKLWKPVLNFGKIFKIDSNIMKKYSKLWQFPNFSPTFAWSITSGVVSAFAIKLMTWDQFWR